MPKSFLIYRRRKLPSSAVEQPDKFRRVLKPCFRSEDDATHTDLSVSRELCPESRCNKKNNNAKILFSGKLLENEPGLYRSINAQHVPFRREASHVDFTCENKGNVYFQSVAVKSPTEGWTNLSINIDRGKNSNFTAKDCTKEYETLNDNNNNNVIRKENHDMCISNEVTADRKDNIRSFVEQSLNPDLTSASNLNTTTTHSSVQQVVKVTSHDSLFHSQIKLIMTHKEVAANKLHRESPADDPSMKHINTSNRVPFASAEKHQIITHTTSQTYLSLNLNKIPQASMSKSNYDDNTVERDLDVSKNDGITVERDLGFSKNDGITVERDLGFSKNDGITVERDLGFSKNDGITVERDLGFSKNDGITVERDLGFSKNDGITVERDLGFSKNDGITVERDLGFSKNDGITVERDLGFSKNDGITVERDLGFSNNDGITVERDLGFSKNDGITVERDLGFSKNDGITVERDSGCSKNFHRKLSMTFPTENRRFSILETIPERTSLTNDAKSMSTKLLSLSWPNGMGYCNGQYEKQINCLENVGERGLLRQTCGVADPVDGTGGKNREIDVAKMKDGTLALHRRLLESSLNHSVVCSSLSQTMCNQRKPPSTNPTSLFQLSKEITSCEYITSDAVRISQGCQDGHAKDNNSSHISLGQSMSSSVFHHLQKNNLPGNILVNKVAPSDSNARTSPKETYHAITCLSDVNVCPLTTSILPSGQSALASNQETKTHAIPTQEQCDQINNKEIQNSIVYQKSLLNQDPQQHVSPIPSIKVGKKRKRPFKSFMISNIINDRSDSDEDDIQTVLAANCYTNSQTYLPSTHSALEGFKDIPASSINVNLLEGQHLHLSPINYNLSSQTSQTSCSDLAEQAFDNHTQKDRHSKESPNKDDKNKTDLTLINSFKIQRNRDCSTKKTCSSIFSPLTNISHVQDIHVSSHDSGDHGLFSNEFYKKSAAVNDEKLSSESFTQEQKLNLSSETQTKYVSPSSVQNNYLRIPALPQQTDLLSCRVIPPEQVNGHAWRRTVKGVYNPMPMRYQPVATFFNNFTPALYWQPSLPPSTLSPSVLSPSVLSPSVLSPSVLSPSIHAEMSNHNIVTISKNVDQVKDHFFSLRDTLRHSPGCDSSSNVSSVSPLTASSILSPISLRGTDITQDKCCYSEVSRQLFQSKDKLFPKSDSSYSYGEKVHKPEINECKSFKSILEQRNVKLECINGGNGIKNPLLNTDFMGNKLGLVPTCALSCPVCNITFDLAKHLQKHLKTHREIKRFLCSFCGKGFNDTFDLKRHTRTHTGVRPYKCNMCDKAFTQRCSLESHCRKIHGLTEQLAFNERRLKVYVCELCGHSTDQADDHYAHNRIAHPTSQLKRRVSM